MKNNIFIIMLVLLVPILQAFSQNNVITLNQVVTEALKTQPQLKASGYNIKSLEKQIDIIGYDNLPQLGYGLNVSQWKWLMPNKVKLLGDNLTDIYTELRANQLIYNGGKVSLQSDLAENSVRYEKLNYSALEQRVILNVSKAYFEVLKAKRVLSIYKNTLEQLKDHLKTADALYNIGKASNLDVVKAKVQIALIEEEIKKAENNVQAQFYALNNAIGWETDKQIDIDDATETFYAGAANDSYSAPELLNEMFSSNPEFKKVQLDYEAKNQEMNLNNADYYPSLYAFGSMNWEDSKMRIPLSNYKWNVGVLLSYNIPFLQGGRFKEKNQQVEIKKDVIRANEESLKKRFELNLKTVLLKLEDLKSRISSSENIVELAKESQKTAGLKYSIGSGSSLDVIDAVQTLSTAEINLSQNLLDYLSTLADLHNIIGRSGSAFSVGQK